MTGNNFLLDTNIIIAWLKGEKTIAEKIDKASIPENDIWIAAIAPTL
ncbi:MAG: hypothetical protein M3Z26_10175 [Bacteroidota bacterium]|nr:hypothetical protein [Bacteroidota bacterium]